MHTASRKTTRYMPVKSSRFICPVTEDGAHRKFPAWRRRQKARTASELTLEFRHTERTWRRPRRKRISGWKGERRESDACGGQGDWSILWEMHVRTRGVLIYEEAVAAHCVTFTATEYMMKQPINDASPCTASCTYACLDTYSALLPFTVVLCKHPPKRPPPA
jgi:hypothetical protein